MADKESKDDAKTAKKTIKAAAKKVKKGLDKKLPPWLTKDESGKVVAKSGKK